MITDETEEKMIDAQEAQGPRPEKQAMPGYTGPVITPGGSPWRSPSAIQEDPRSKSPVLAAVLSLMPGLGQVYVGYYVHGFTNILVIASLITLLARGIGDLEPLAGLFLAYYWLYTVVDAARRAAFYNQALVGLGPMELPKDLQMPGSGGSLFGGIALIVLGGLALAYTRFNVSLAWLERWWPLALVIAGVYLIYKSWAAKRKSA